MTMSLLETIPSPPSADLLGRRLLAHDVAKGWVRIVFEAKPGFLDSDGTIQAGFLSAMLEESMRPAAWIMTEGEFSAATLGMAVTFLAPARPGPLYGEGQVVQLRKTIVFLEGRLVDARGRLVARATASARLIPATKAVAERRRAWAAAG
jgi:uncharacterized protein (TIGR00369 family)